MPDPTRRPSAHIVRAVQPIHAKATVIGDNVVLGVRSDLKAAQAATMDRLSHATQDWDIHQAQGVIAELRRQMATFDTNTVSALGSGMAETHGLGQDAMLAAISKGGGAIVSVAPLVSTRVLRVARETLPDLITNVSDETIQKVSRILRASVLGQTGPFDAMQKIALFIPNIHGDAGPFGGAMLRSETIVRTEISRTLQTASFDTLQGLAENDSSYGKQWSATMDDATRESHAEADGQEQAVSDPFQVGDDELMYPGDPGGSPEETINCRCAVLPVNSNWPSDMGGDYQPGGGDGGGEEG